MKCCFEGIVYHWHHECPAKRPADGHGDISLTTRIMPCSLQACTPAQTSVCVCSVRCVLDAERPACRPALQSLLLLSADKRRSNGTSPRAERLLLRETRASQLVEREKRVSRDGRVCPGGVGSGSGRDTGSCSDEPKTEKTEHGMWRVWGVRCSRRSSSSSSSSRSTRCSQASLS